MNLELSEKTVVVTGGSKGIGYATAKTFLEEGANVFICARNENELNSAVKELKNYGNIKGFVLDGTKEKDMEKLAYNASQLTSNIDIWINNIGTNKKRANEYYSEEELDFLISANYKSCVFGTQAAVKFMKNNGGAIVNVASLAAYSATAIRSNIYASMKAAVLAYTRTTAAEYAKYKIRINAILPGYTETPLVKNSFTSESLDEILKNNILNRMAQPEEIAKPIVFLSSSAASYITGTDIEVTGGHIKVLNARECWK